MQDFIDTYLAYTEEQESPYAFHLWMALWTIAATLERHIWFDKGFYKVYPNLYTVLVAGSSFCRKSTAIEIGVGLLKKLDRPPTINSDLTSPERFLAKLSASTAVRVKGETREVVSACAVTAPELSIFLGEKATNHRMVSILSELYACPNEWSQDTLKRGMEKLRNVCVNLIGASTVSWLKKSLSHREMEGGFANRIIWVCQDGTDKIRPFPVMTDKMKAQYKALIERLNIIRTIRGPVTLSKGARKWYEGWYDEFRNKDTTATPGFLDSYLGRRQDHLIKLGMLMAVSRGAEVDLIIEQADFERGNSVLNTTESLMPALFEEMLIHSEEGEIASKVWSVIYKAKEIEVRVLIRRLWRVATAERIYKTLTTFKQAGMIEEFYKGDGSSGTGDKAKPRYIRVVEEFLNLANPMAIIPIPITVPVDSLERTPPMQM